MRRRREDLCQKEDLDLWQSISWLRNNESKFAETVYEPARICVNVKERRYAKFAEAAINYTTLKVWHKLPCIDAVSDRFEIDFHHDEPLGLPDASGLPQQSRLSRDRGPETEHCRASEGETHIEQLSGAMFP